MTMKDFILSSTEETIKLIHSVHKMVVTFDLNFRQNSWKKQKNR